MAERYSLLPVGTGNPYPENTARHAAYEEGRASLAASAGSEPVAWKHDCAALLANDVELWIDACPHCGKPRMHATQAAHPSPPEGMVGGWISVEDRLPKLYTEVLIHPRPTAYCCEGEVDTQGRWSYGEYETGFGHHQIACEVTHWMPLPPPPTTSAGSGKGE